MPPYHGGRHRAKRPTGWTKEFVLARFKEGANLKEICSEARAMCLAEGIDPLAQDAFRREIFRWRDEDDDFRKGFAEAKAERYGLGNFGGGIAKAPIPRLWDDEAKNEFIEKLPEFGGNIPATAKAMGVRPGYVYELLRRTSTSYDPLFHDRFMLAEGDRLAGIREKFYKEAEEGGKWGTGDVWAQQKILEARLADLHNATKQVQVEVSGTVNHQHSLAPATLDALARQMNALVSARNAQESLPPHEEGDVIDAEELVDARSVH